MKDMPKKYDTVCANGNEDATVWRVVDVMPPMVGIVVFVFKLRNPFPKACNSKLVKRDPRCNACGVAF